MKIYLNCICNTTFELIIIWLVTRTMKFRIWYIRPTAPDSANENVYILYLYLYFIYYILYLFMYFYFSSCLSLITMQYFLYCYISMLSLFLYYLHPMEKCDIDRGARNFRVFCLLPQLPRFSPFWKTRSRFSLCLKLCLQFLPFLLQISHYLSFFYSQISFLVKFQSNTRFITMKICNNNVLW